jgi:hypothetical protein
VACGRRRGRRSARPGSAPLAPRLERVCIAARKRRRAAEDVGQRHQSRPVEREHARRERHADDETGETEADRGPRLRRFGQSPGERFDRSGAEQPGDPAPRRRQAVGQRGPILGRERYRAAEQDHRQQQQAEGAPPATAVRGLLVLGIVPQLAGEGIEHRHEQHRDDAEQEQCPLGGVSPAMPIQLRTSPPAAVDKEGSVWVYDTSASATNSVAAPSTAAPASWPARASERRNAARQSAGCARPPLREIAREAIVVPSSSERRT